MPSYQCICQKCSKEFASKKSEAKYCSKACWSVRATVECVCEQCNAPFRIERNRIETANYCSRECQGLARRVVLRYRKCDRCGNEFQLDVKHQQQRYCSHECFAVGQTDKVAVSCGYCRRDIFVSKCRKNKRRYCSKECKKAARSVEIECAYCKAVVCVGRASKERKYCGRECQRAAGNVRITLFCEQCGRAYQKRQIHTKGAKFCSRKCQWTGWAEAAAKRRVQLQCEQCKSFYRTRSHLAGKQRFCSRSCWAAYNVARQGKVSKSETVLFDCLEARGLILKRQVRIRGFVIDAVSVHWNAAIEFDGEYWHSRPGMAERDGRKAVAVAWAGYKLIRVPEREWIDDPEATISRVMEEVRTL